MTLQLCNKVWEGIGHVPHPPFSHKQKARKMKNALENTAPQVKL